MDSAGNNSYQAVDLKTQTAGASAVQLVLVLIDQLLDEICRARSHIEHKRYEAKGKSINRCIDILVGLSSSLDHESSNEAVTHLAQLYEYCVWRLNEAGCKLDPEILDEVTKLITTLRDSWQRVQER